MIAPGSIFVRFLQLFPLAAIALFAAQPQLVFREDFEHCTAFSSIAYPPPDSAGFCRFFKHAGGPSARIVDRPGDSASQGHALQFSLDTGHFEATPNGKRYHNRSELEPFDRFERIKPEQKNCWYAFSIMFPEDFKSDTLYEIVAQWHIWPWKHNPDGTVSTSPQSSPSVAVYSQGDSIYLWIMWYDDPVMAKGKPGPGRNITRYCISDQKRGSWQRIVLHIYWDWNNNSETTKGLVECWVNGLQSFQPHRGGNTYRPPKGTIIPYFKFGIYKYFWGNKIRRIGTATHRTVYFDDIVQMRGNGIHPNELTLLP